MNNLKSEILKISWIDAYTIMFLDEDYSMWYMELGLNDIGLVL